MLHTLSTGDGPEVPGQRRDADGVLWRVLRLWWVAPDGRQIGHWCGKRSSSGCVAISQGVFGDLWPGSVQFTSLHFIFKTLVYGTPPPHPSPASLKRGCPHIFFPLFFFQCRWRPLASPHSFCCSFFLWGGGVCLWRSLARSSYFLVYEYCT